jgi:glucose/mannose-6-phosphate isomerase
MIEHIKNFPKHIEDSLKDLKDHNLKLEEISKVVIAGMGGSAIAGLILKDLFPEMDIVVERNYFPNTTIDEHTLVIVCSYSGNTEETLSYYDYAVRLTDHAMVLTTGGELLKKAKLDNISYHLLPKGYPPRSALGFSLTFLISIFDKEGVSNIDIDCLKTFSKEAATKKSEVYALAKKIYKTMPIIVTEEDLSSIGFRLKSQLNENSKMLSYNIAIPEMNHNEIIGWENKNIDKKFFSMIWIHIGWPKNVERMKITNEILSKKVSHVAHLTIPDKVPKNLTSLFFLINYIDWLSYWCGILNDVDIDAVKSIDLLKKKIS